MTADKALLAALADPALSTAQREALVLALRVVLGQPAAPAPATAPPARPRQSNPAPTGSAEHRQRLTKAAVAALPLPEKGERLVYDTDAPQLAVRLRPNGRTYIVIAWDRSRHRKTSRTLGKCTALTPEQARAEAWRQVGRLAEGDDIRRERRDGLTVRELVAKWHAEKAETTRTADELRDKVLHYLGPQADQVASTLTREDIGRIHHEIATKARRRVFKIIDKARTPVEIGEPGLPATADKWRASLSAVYAWGKAKGMVDENPCEGIPPAFDAKQAARTNYLHGDALVKFWRALDADRDGDARDAIRLMLFTGQRRGNVLAMRWADLDLDAAVWMLGAKQTKQSRAQGTPLVPQALEILRRRKESAAREWVFAATRSSADGTVGPMSEMRVRDAWGRVCGAAGITDLRPHDLRHTAGSWLARLGANEAVRQKALGHQTPAMAARYSHLELDPVAEAMTRVADAITEAAQKS